MNYYVNFFQNLSKFVKSQNVPELRKKKLRSWRKEIERKKNKNVSDCLLGLFKDNS